METINSFERRLGDMHRNGGSPRSLKRKIWSNYSTPSGSERYANETQLLDPFEKRMKAAQWEPRISTRTKLFPASVQPLRNLEQSYNYSFGSFDRFTVPLFSPRPVPAADWRARKAVNFATPGFFSVPRETGIVYKESQIVPRDSDTLSSAWYKPERDRGALTRDEKDRENDALREELKAEKAFRRDAMEGWERAEALSLKKESELEEFRRRLAEPQQNSEQAEKAFRRDAMEGWERAEALSLKKESELEESRRRLAGPQQNSERAGPEFQIESGTDGLASEDLRTSGNSSLYFSGAVSLSGSQPNEGNVASGSNGRDRELEPTWKELLNKVHEPAKVEKTISLGKEIEYTLSKLQALQLERRPGLKAEKKPEDKTLVDAFTPLSAEAEDAVDEALEAGNRYEILVTHEESNIDVTRGIMQCLSPGVWLNDEVINVYMELLKEREVREPDRFLKCHFFNTFFYNKLYKDKRSYDYKAIRRWTTQKKLGYSLSDCDKILVPIHQDIHWCLAVINIRDKRLEYLDSLKGGDGSVLDVLARYITDEAKEKDGKVLDARTWEQDFPKNIPEQLNGCDCGMFMVKYADFHSRGAPLQFTQEHMEYFRRKMVWEILDLKAT